MKQVSLFPSVMEQIQGNFKTSKHERNPVWDTLPIIPLTWDRQWHGSKITHRKQSSGLTAGHTHSSERDAQFLDRGPDTRGWDTFVAEQQRDRGLFQPGSLSQTASRAGPDKIRMCTKYHWVVSHFTLFNPHPLSTLMSLSCWPQESSDLEP